MADLGSAGAQVLLQAGVVTVRDISCRGRACPSGSGESQGEAACRSLGSACAFQAGQSCPGWGSLVCGPLWSLLLPVALEGGSRLCPADQDPAGIWTVGRVVGQQVGWAAWNWGPGQRPVVVSLQGFDGDAYIVSQQCEASAVRVTVVHLVLQVHCYLQLQIEPIRVA